nr:hypothetical protein [Candidatus Enterousia merdequi]
MNANKITLDDIIATATKYLAKDLLGISENNIHENSNLHKDFKIDSLDKIELLVAIENTLDIKLTCDNEVLTAISLKDFCKICYADLQKSTKVINVHDIFNVAKKYLIQNRGLLNTNIDTNSNLSCDLNLVTKSDRKKLLKFIEKQLNITLTCEKDVHKVRTLHEFCTLCLHDLYVQKNLKVPRKESSLRNTFNKIMSELVRDVRYIKTITR